jgi:hypothetical protein
MTQSSFIAWSVEGIAKPQIIPARPRPNGDIVKGLFILLLIGICFLRARLCLMLRG